MNNIKSKERVDKFGEVMTPEVLIEEMLDSLPNEVWANPDNKWIDNSCGNGNFLVKIKERLLKYHSENHILKKMMWGVDIQADNVNETIKRLGGGNICCHDALTFDYWGHTKFDIVVGNPPYNNEKKGKRGNNCNPLWNIFVEFIIDNILNDCGIMCLVHPPLWRKPEHKLWEKMKKYQFDKIRIFSTKESSKIFGVSTKVDYYVMRKSPPNKKTKIVGEDDKTYSGTIYNKSFIPNKCLSEAYNVFGGQREIIYSCAYHHYTQKHMSKNKTDTYKYPCIYLANKKGITYNYSSVNDRGHFGTPKIIVPLGSFCPIVDNDGEYGMCEVCFGIPFSSAQERDKILRLFKSEMFVRALDSCRWKTFQYDYRLFKYLNIDVIN